VFQPNTRGQERVPDNLYAEAAKHYEEKALATLMAVLGSASFWMTIAILLKPPPAGQGAESA
jgi:hypothetical protein